jgi:3-hydroxy acid dehydrogenase/malonic semialdehyde reductase
MNSNSSPLRGHLALITGATSGIGLATAEALAQRGADLILTGRRAERLLAEKIRIEKVYGVQVTTLEFDVTKREQIESIFKRQDLAGTFSKLSILVNNAGLAKGAEAMPQASLNDWDEMVDTNIKGLLYMTFRIS